MVFTQEPVPKHIECKYVTMAANSVAVWVCWNDEIFWWYRLKFWAGNGITVLMNVFLFAPLPPEQKLQLYQINYIFLNVFSNWADLERMKWEKKICWYSFSWIFDGVLTKYFKDKVAFMLHRDNITDASTLKVQQYWNTQDIAHSNCTLYSIYHS